MYFMIHFDRIGQPMLHTRTDLFPYCFLDFLIFFSGSSRILVKNLFSSSTSSNNTLCSIYRACLAVPWAIQAQEPSPVWTPSRVDHHHSPWHPSQPSQQRPTFARKLLDERPNPWHEYWCGHPLAPDNRYPRLSPMFNWNQLEGSRLAKRAKPRSSDACLKS